MDKDTDFLFEQYQKIYEAPIGPGSGWDDDVEIDPDQSERLGKSQYGSIVEDDIHRVIANIKTFLSEHEGSVYPGSMDDMKTEIKVIIQDTIEGVNATKANYASRVIRNELKRLNVIDDVPGVDQVQVKDVSEVDTLSDELEDSLDGDGQTNNPTPFLLSQVYRVERDDLPMSASQDAKDVHELLLKAGMIFNTHTGKDIVKASGLPYSKAKTIIAELIDIGAVHLPDQEDDDTEDRIVDVGDEEGKEDYGTAVSGEYEKLRRDISGGEAITMRPDDF